MWWWWWWKERACAFCMRIMIDEAVVVEREFEERPPGPIWSLCLSWRCRRSWLMLMWIRLQASPSEIHEYRLDQPPAISSSFNDTLERMAKRNGWSSSRLQTISKLLANAHDPMLVRNRSRNSSRHVRDTAFSPEYSTAPSGDMALTPAGMKSLKVCFHTALSAAEFILWWLWWFMIMMSWGSKFGSGPHHMNCMDIITTC